MREINREKPVVFMSTEQVDGLLRIVKYDGAHGVALQLRDRFDTLAPGPDFWVWAHFGDNAVQTGESPYWLLAADGTTTRWSGKEAE